MNALLENLIPVCVMAAAVELAAGLCSKNAMVDFVKALVILVLLVSAIAALFSVDWDVWKPQEAAEIGGELSAYVEEQTAEAARQEASDYLTGLLAAAGIEPEKIEPVIDIEEDGSIVLKKVNVVFRFASEGERAEALLRNVLGGETEVEVLTDGR